MFLTVVVGFLSVVSLGRVVLADPLTILTVESAKIVNKPNDYFDPWDIEIIKTKKNSQLSVKIPTKKELPASMNFKITIIIPGQDPIEYEMSVCDALMDQAIGQSFVKAGLPKGKFPGACPFGPGDWSISKWDPDTSKIPPGVPDGTITGSVMILEEGNEPYVQIDYEGVLSHPMPGLGR